MRKITTLFLFAFFITLFAADAYAKKFSVNFKNIPMKDFITFVAEFTGKNLIYNEADIRGNVTISSQKEMDEKEVMDIFYTVLKMNGYLPIVNADNIQIIAEKDIPLYDEDVTSKNTKNENYITSVISFQYYNAGSLIPILNRLKSRTGYIEPVRGLNILVVRDMSSRIDKMMSLIKQVDKEANTFKFHTIQLNYAVASKMEQQLNKLYGELGKNAIFGTVPSIVSDDLSNTLIIACTDAEYPKIEYLIKSFDNRNNTSITAPKIYYLRNSKAEDVEKVLSKMLGSMTPAGAQANQPNAIKSNISSDKATNSIIAFGDQELYANLSALIEKMDIPRRQVFVEALILETSIDRELQFGVEWFGGASNAQGALVGGLTNSGALGNLIGPITQGNAPNISALPSGLAVGIIGNLISFNGAKFPSIGALVSALRGTSGVNIVSNPQILTLDNADAEVFVGENRPFVTSEKFDNNNNPIQTYDYRDVGVKLKITPQISSNDMVTLNIEQEVKKYSSATMYAAAPVTLTRSTKTLAKLQNRSILLISGMIKDDTSVSESGIPLLSEIPVLGWLFKTKKVSVEKTNLMVFITSQIIDTVDDAKVLMKVKEDAMKQFNNEADKEFGSVFIDRESGSNLQQRVEGKVFINPLIIDNKTISVSNEIIQGSFEGTQDNIAGEAKP